MRKISYEKQRVTEWMVKYTKKLKYTCIHIHSTRAWIANKLLCQASGRASDWFRFGEFLVIWMELKENVCVRARLRDALNTYFCSCAESWRSRILYWCVCLCGRRLTYGSLYYDLNVVIWRPFARCKLIGCVVIFDITFQAHTRIGVRFMDARV